MGLWSLCFSKGSTGSALRPPVVGEVPPVLMMRLFTRTSGGVDCPANLLFDNCADTFVVPMTKR